MRETPGKPLLGGSCQCGIQEIQSGWFTPDQMKTELKWSQLLNRKSYVHDVPTSEHLLKGLVLDIGIINMRDCKEFMHGGDVGCGGVQIKLRRYVNAVSIQRKNLKLFVARKL